MVVEFCAGRPVMYRSDLDMAPGVNRKLSTVCIKRCIKHGDVRLCSIVAIAPQYYAWFWHWMYCS